MGALKNGAALLITALLMVLPLIWIAVGNETFCTSSDAMDMHMTGFKTVFASSDTPCVVLWFQGWDLDTKWKFSIAAMSVAALAVVTEYFLSFRRQVEKRVFKRMGADIRDLSSAALHVNQLLLGYFLMLVAMTYQLELLVYLLAGFFIGFLLFNSTGFQTGFEAADPCCATPASENSSLLPRPSS